MAFTTRGGKKKLHCEKTVLKRDGDCLNSEIIPDKLKCKNGHYPDEAIESERREVEGFNILAHNDFPSSNKKSEELPRTPRKIYDEILKRSS